MASFKIEVGRIAVPTSGTELDCDISGFGTPKGAMFILTAGVTDDTIATTGKMGIGWTDGTRNVCFGMNANGTSTSMTSRFQRTDSCAASVNSGDTSDMRLSFNSWNANGVKLNIDDNPPSAYLLTYILFGGTDIANFYTNIRDDLGNGTSAIDINTVGFEPTIVMMGCTGLATAPSTANPHGLFSFGIGINDTDDPQAVMMYSDEDNLGTSEIMTYIGDDSIAGQAYFGSLGWDAVIQDYDPDGFSINPNANAGTDVVMYCCIELTGSPDVALFNMSWPTSGNYAETNPGFEPIFGLICSSQGPTTRNTAATSGNGSAAIAVFDASNIYTNTITGEDAVATMNQASLSSDQLRIIDDDGSSNEVLATFAGFDSSGWDFTLSTNPGTEQLGFALAIGLNDGGGGGGLSIPVAMNSYRQRNNLSFG